MKTLSSKSKFIVLAAVIAAASVGFVIHVRAQGDTTLVQDRRGPLFGIMGITRTQTVRINLVNVSSPDDPFVPPDPCRVVMAFVDSSGDVLRNSDGQPIRREAMLGAGDASFLQINGENLVPRDQVRLNFRPVVRVFVTPNSDGTIPPDPCVPTLEVIDNTSARTTLLSAGTRLF